MNIFYFAVIVAVLVLGGVAAWVVYRWAQDRRLLDEVVKRCEIAEGRYREIKQSLQAEKVQTNWYKALFSRVGELVFVFSLNEDGSAGVCLDVNDTACDLLGYKREEILGHGMDRIESIEDDFITGDSGISKIWGDEYITARKNRLFVQKMRKRIQKAMEDGRIVYQTVFRDREGNACPVEVTMMCRTIDVNTVLVISARRMQAEIEVQQSLAESEKKFRLFFERMPIGAAIYSADKVLKEVNRTALRIFGVPDAEEFSKIHFWDGSFVPSYAAITLARGDSVSYEAVIDFVDWIRNGRLITTRKDKAYLLVDVMHLGLDSNYKPLGWMVQIQDITEKRIAEEELKAREEQLRQAEKMEALGSMAGGIAHDFNNILTPIIGYAQLLEMKLGKDETFKEIVQSILRNSLRAKDLVSQILMFSRKEDNIDELKPIHVIPIVKEILKSQSINIPANVELERIIKTTEDTVMATPVYIHQIIMNLISNALYAVKDRGGKVELLLTDLRIGKTGASKFPELKEGRYLCIIVRDTGVGMKPEVLKRIFEPFFTTKPRGEGTGMGMAVVHGIVRRLNGAIDVESEFGKGTKVSVLLPLVTAPVEEMETVIKDSIVTGNHEKILIVDDDSDAGESLKRILEECGYEAVFVSYSNAAERIIKMDPNRFALAIIDYLLPTETGLDLVERIRTINPDLPIIINTGQGDGIHKSDLQRCNISAVIQKPIDIIEVSRLVRKVINERNK